MNKAIRQLYLRLMTKHYTHFDWIVAYGNNPILETTYLRETYDLEKGAVTWELLAPGCVK